MIKVLLVDGFYVVTMAKCTLVLTKTEFITALRRGKWWKRRQALNARLAEAGRDVHAREAGGR